MTNSRRYTAKSTRYYRRDLMRVLEGKRPDRLGVAEFALLYFGGGACIALWRGLRRLARRAWSVLQTLGVLATCWWWVLWERKRVTRR